MRSRIIAFLRNHPTILDLFWKMMRIGLYTIGIFIPVRNQTILFASFGGRKFDDSPRAIYEEIIQREEFRQWDLVWAFVNPEDYDIPRGRKIEIDTPAFFKALLYSKVWVCNSGMDRNIGIDRKATIKIETWHGTPLKKIGVDQNTGVLGNQKLSSQKDCTTIRCAQSEYDRSIFARVFNADENSFLLCDLPRNDILCNVTEADRKRAREKVGVPHGKKAILYMPTYREFQKDEKSNYVIDSPIDFRKWHKEIGEKYVVLFRAHYAVVGNSADALDGFVRDVSNYPNINDLYMAADLLVSDYSSAFVDYSILERPMACYAYDYVLYDKLRGLYVDMKEEFAGRFFQDEDNLINHIKNLNEREEIAFSKKFHNKYSPNAGNASKKIVNELIKRLGSTS